MPSSLTYKRIPAWELRKLFNDGNFWQKAEAGELTQKLLRDGHPSPPACGEPVCTRSQSIAYYDPAGNLVAKVHQYLKADGKIGASGRPDPKRLRIGDTVYIVKKEDLI